jgi:hypothetical protein
MRKIAKKIFEKKHCMPKPSKQSSTMQISPKKERKINCPFKHARLLREHNLPTSH